MILQIVCVRDRALDSFGRPVFVGSTGQAVRSFQDEVNGKEGDVSRHPEDFELFHLGTYDDATGTFEQFSRPRSIAVASSLVVKS